MISDYIKKVLFELQQSILNNAFIDLEKTKIDIKDLSNGNKWKSFYETVCAYLNTDGGYIICGINENNKKYTFTGFNRNNESNLIELHNKHFTDDNGIFIDLSDKIKFEYFPFLNSEIVVVKVLPLADDLKYVKFGSQYFERKLTQDTKISSSKILLQKEYKIEVEYAKELMPIAEAGIVDISLDKINNYISLLNREIRSETLKSTILQEQSFLTKQHFIKKDKITTLGMLVCGDEPFVFLNSRAEVNCYFDTSQDIGNDKKIFRNDVLNLMEDTFRYIWSNIKINRTVREGGKSEPEYPENLIRESINNALAHRDYTIDNFVTVTVEPNKYVEIKNPGSFKEKIKIINTETDIPIRRLIAGIPDSKNPKLAAVLKVFDKIESQGRGMSSLVNAALENQIDLPTYEIKGNSIILKINHGKLVDEKIQNWLDGFDIFIINQLKSVLSFDHKTVLAYFYKSEIANKKRLYTVLLTESNNHFEVIQELKNADLIFEHEASTDENPIYLLNRILINNDFTNDLLKIIGNDYIHYEDITKKILNLVFQHTKFNNKSLKASDITPQIYLSIYGKEIVGKTFETLGRKTRNICNKLETMKIFEKGSKNDYLFNLKYIKNDSFFMN